MLVLQKGKMLYSGKVDELTHNEGFFELKSDDLEKLKSVIKNHSAVEKIVEQDDKIVVYLNSNLEPQELNSYLFENKIVLQHLVKRKNSLEEQFLELTKNVE